MNEQNNCIKLWRADVSLKSVLRLHPETPSALIYVSEQVLDEAQNPSNGRPGMSLADLTRAFKAQLFFNRVGDKEVIVACGVIEEGLPHLVYFKLHALGEDLILDGACDPTPGSWKDMKVYRRERMWDINSARTIKTHRRKQTKGRIRER